MENTPTRLPYHVTETITRGGATFELLEYEPLAGCEPVGLALQCYEMNRAGVRLRQLRVKLQNDSVRTEPGALQFMKGSLEMVSSTGGVHFSVEKASTSLLGAATSGEWLLQTFRGSGKVWIAPTQPIYGKLGGLSVTV